MRGCFSIEISKATTKTGVRVRPSFILVQHIRDKLLMRSLIELLGCGTVYVSKEAVYLTVKNFSDIETKVVPFFVKYPILGVKTQDFKY